MRLEENTWEYFAILPKMSVTMAGSQQCKENCIKIKRESSIFGKRKLAKGNKQMHFSSCQHKANSDKHLFFMTIFLMIWERNIMEAMTFQSQGT